MRVNMALVIIPLTLATPAFATSDSFNQLSPPDIRTGESNIGWSYNWKSIDSAERVLAQLRAVCKSDDRYDQKRCARGTTILKNAYAEFQLRRAAQEIVAH